jgi:hypothetical protein
MKKISPGYNEEGWTMEVTCTGLPSQGGGSGVLGCGSSLLIEKNDLYLVTFDAGMGGIRTEARYNCVCGIANLCPVNKKFFTGLPVK